MTPTVHLPAIILTALATLCAYSLLYRLFRAHPRTLYLTAATVTLWFLLTGTLAHRGFFTNFTSLPPHLLFALLLPAIAFAIFALTSKTLPEALRETPLPWLIAFQTFRIIVELVLWRAYRAGAIPVQMTFEGRNLDILIGLSAPIVAWLYASRRINETIVRIWTIVGILTLTNIVARTLLTFSGVVQTEIADTGIGLFPFTFLPGFLAPHA